MDFSLFDHKNSLLLPAYNKPHPDEIFSSWLVRLSYAHYLKAHTFSKHVFNSVSIWNRDIDRKFSDEKIKMITQRTNTTFKEVSDCFLASYEGRLFLECKLKTNSKWILPLGIYHRIRKKNGFMFCPLCLKHDGQDPYYRKSWRISLNIVCTHCKSYLQDCCPKCKMPVIFYRLDLGDKRNTPDKKISLCFNCKFDLSNAEIIFADAIHFKIQSYFNNILLEGLNQEIFYPHLFFDVLYHFCKLINSKSPPGLIIRKKLNNELNLNYYPVHINNSNLFENIGIEDRIKTLTGAYFLINNWPNDFINFFTGTNIWSSFLLKDLKDIPYWYKSLIIDNFFVSNINRHF